MICFYTTALDSLCNKEDDKRGAKVQKPATAEGLK